MLATLLLSSLVLVPEFPVKVTLLDVGEAPRQELRYSPEVGSEYSLVLRIDSTLRMEAEDLDSGERPDLRLRGQVVTDAVTPEGRILQHIDGFEYDYEPLADTTAEELAALRGGFDDLHDVKVSLEYDNRGRLLEFRLDSPRVDDVAFRMKFEEIRRLLCTLSVPVPTDLVGPGGKWSVEQPAHIAFVEATETRTVHWIESEEGPPQFEFAVEVAARSQEHADYVGTRKRHTLHSIEHEESGAYVFDPRFLQPAAYSASLTEITTSSTVLADNAVSTHTRAVSGACALTVEEAEAAVPRRAVPGPSVEEQVEAAYREGRLAAFRELAGDLIQNLPAETHKGYGDWYLARGATMEAAAYYLLALERDPELTIARYRLACAMTALTPDSEVGLDWLEKAVEAGFWGAPTLKDEEVFEPHRESERFQALLATVEKRYANAVLDWTPRSIVAVPDGPAEGTKFPVLVFLHGYGDNHLSYSEKISAAAANGLVGIAVSGTVPFCEDRMRWNQLDVESTHDAIQAALARHAGEGVPLDESRIFLAGFSQGALHATNLLALYPESYAGGIAISIGGSQELVAPLDVNKHRPLFGIWGGAEQPGNIALMEEAREHWGKAIFPWREHVHDGGHYFPADWDSVFPDAVAWLLKNE